jgi:hypothetical protein
MPPEENKLACFSMAIISSLSAVKAGALMRGVREKTPSLGAIYIRDSFAHGSSYIG